MDKSVADDFIAKLKARAERVKVGDGMDEGTDMGPSIDEPQWKKVLEAIDRAKTSGAKLRDRRQRLDDGRPLARLLHAARPCSTT